MHRRMEQERSRSVKQAIKEIHAPLRGYLESLNGQQGIWFNLDALFGWVIPKVNLLQMSGAQALPAKFKDPPIEPMLPPHPSKQAACATGGGPWSRLRPTLIWWPKAESTIEEVMMRPEEHPGLRAWRVDDHGQPRPCALPKTNSQALGRGGWPVTNRHEEELWDLVHQACQVAAISSDPRAEASDPPGTAGHLIACMRTARAAARHAARFEKWIHDEKERHQQQKHPYGPQAGQEPCYAPLRAAMGPLLAAGAAQEEGRGWLCSTSRDSQLHGGNPEVAARMDSALRGLNIHLPLGAIEAGVRGLAYLDELARERHIMNLRPRNLASADQRINLGGLERTPEAPGNRWEGEVHAQLSYQISRAVEHSWTAGERASLALQLVEQADLAFAAAPATRISTLEGCRLSGEESDRQLAKELADQLGEVEQESWNSWCKMASLEIGLSGGTSRQGLGMAPTSPLPLEIGTWGTAAAKPSESPAALKMLKWDGPELKHGEFAGDEATHLAANRPPERHPRLIGTAPGTSSEDLWRASRWLGTRGTSGISGSCSSIERDMLDPRNLQAGAEAARRGARTIAQAMQGEAQNSPTTLIKGIRQELKGWEPALLENLLQVDWSEADGEWKRSAASHAELIMLDPRWIRLCASTLGDSLRSQFQQGSQLRASSNTTLLAEEAEQRAGRIHIALAKANLAPALARDISAMEAGEDQESILSSMIRDTPPKRRRYGG